MSHDADTRRPSLPMVPASFLLLIVLCAGLWWWRGAGNTSAGTASPSGPMGSGILQPFRTPGGTLQTNGITKTEEIRRESDSWNGTTASGIRLNAIYRYEVELRSSHWNLHVDEARRLAFLVAPPIKPQLPVAVDSDSVQEWTSSGWGRFDKWDHLQELRKNISSVLEEKARSGGYVDIARENARKTVEEFARDWMLKNRPMPEGLAPVIKVYFSDERDIPFPAGTSLEDYLP